MHWLIGLSQIRDDLLEPSVIIDPWTTEVIEPAVYIIVATTDTPKLPFDFILKLAIASQSMNTARSYTSMPYPEKFGFQELKLN